MGCGTNSSIVRQDVRGALNEPRGVVDDLFLRVAGLLVISSAVVYASSVVG